MEVKVNIKKIEELEDLLEKTLMSVFVLMGRIRNLKEEQLEPNSDR